MAWIRLTRMLERKTKDASRGELRIFAFAGVSPIWFQTEHIAAIYSFKGPVHVTEFETEERDVTAVVLGSQADPFYVVESVDEVTRAVGAPAARARKARSGTPRPRADGSRTG